MDSNLKNVRKLADFCSKRGIIRIKTPEIELEFTPSALRHDSLTSKAIDNIKEVPTSTVTPDTYNEDDLLFWSSGQLPETKE